MIRKIVWLMVSCLMVAALVLASCGPAEEEEEEVTPPPVEEEEEEAPVEEEEEVAPPEGAEMVTIRLEKRDGTVVEKLVENPKYGGMFKTTTVVTPPHFDDVHGVIHNAPTMKITNEELMQFDWSKGPAGTGEAMWIHTLLPPFDLTRGCLAESWERTDDTTLVFHIRQGVHWHNKPPTNGRELDANDVVYSIKRLWEAPTQWRQYSYPWDTMFDSIEATDKWTVVIKFKLDQAAPVFEFLSDHTMIVPQEAIEQYGDLDDWRNSVGTGPFTLVDYVPDSIIVFERNPNYWDKDPIHPQNQLPYLDGLTWLIIPDISTRMAAMRTGKIDDLRVEWEDGESMRKTNPELPYFKYVYGAPSGIFFRTDTPPFDDVRVRQALAMAINQQEIADTLYGGDAELLSYPTAKVLEQIDMRLELDELPESVRKQFEYHPDEARQLLAEAGYPDGFQMSILAFSYPTQIDLLTIVKSYWADIGVNLEINIKEYAVYNTMGMGKTYKDAYMATTVSGTIPTTFIYFKTGGIYNYPIVDDAFFTEKYYELAGSFYDWDKRVELMKEITPYVLEKAWLIQFPDNFYYVFWQPWVKGYRGESQVAYSNHGNFPKYIWLDVALKEAMGY